MCIYAGGGKEEEEEVEREQEFGEDEIFIEFIVLQVGPSYLHQYGLSKYAYETVYHFNFHFMQKELREYVSHVVTEPIDDIEWVLLNISFNQQNKIQERWRC